MVPEAFHRETLQREGDEAGDEAGHEERANCPDRPAKVSPRKDTPVEEQDAIFDGRFRYYPAKEVSVEAL